MRLVMSVRREIYGAHFGRCQKAGKRDKGKILDALAGTMGPNRDCLADVPTSYGKKRSVQAGGERVVLEARALRKKRGPGKRGGRPPKYQDAAFIRLLTRVWEDQS